MKALQLRNRFTGEVRKFDPDLDKRLWEIIEEPMKKPARTLQYLAHLRRVCTVQILFPLITLVGYYYQYEIPFPKGWR